jgi:uncharacterized protein (TIRG00374 family)
LRNWRFWLGIAVSGLFLWLALRSLHLADVWAALLDANYLWLIPGIAVYFVAVWVRTWRWHYLLRPLKAISTRRMFPVVVIGYMGNNIYPARIGELLRAYVLKRREGVPFSASLATILVERLFDGVVMLAFVFLNLGELSRLTGASGFVGDIRSLAVWGTVIFLAALGAFLLLALFPARAAAVAGWFIDRLLPQSARTQSHAIAGRFLEGLASLRSPLDVFMILFTSTCIWLLETGKYWLLMHAFQFQVSFFALMLMNGIVNLATTIPSAPGYVGTFDAPGIAVLQAYGVPGGIAAAYTLSLHAALWLPITLLGFYYMARESLSWRTIGQELSTAGVAR